MTERLKMNRDDLERVREWADRKARHKGRTPVGLVPIYETP